MDGQAFSWRHLVELPRQQLEAWSAEQARQLTLFALRDDRRLQAERTAADRYREPTFFAIIAEARDR